MKGDRQSATRAGDRNTCPRVLDDKDVPLPQAYMFFVVSYPATERPDGTLAKPFYKIRFMRQMYCQQT